MEGPPCESDVWRTFELHAPGGVSAVISNYGARLLSLRVPDAGGRMTEVVLGFGNLSAYRSDRSYMGATIGRFANRIAGAGFVLHGHDYQLTANEGRNALHGGLEGFDKRFWSVEEVGEHKVTLSLQSPDGDGGFPGNLDVTVTYSLEPPARLRIDYRALTDAETVLNLTNHSYFNLSGAGGGTIEDHLLEIAASAFTEIDSALLPTGKIVSVAGTPFDFRKPVRIGDGLAEDDPQLSLAGGYDHNFVLDPGPTGDPLPAARLISPRTNIGMRVSTTEPGLQFYSGQQLNVTAPGKPGVLYNPRSGLCLETQHFPDSPHHCEFPSTVLKAGEAFRSSTIYEFEICRGSRLDTGA